VQIKHGSELYRASRPKTAAPLRQQLLSSIDCCEVSN
jgi:hypothetical protein